MKTSSLRDILWSFNIPRSCYTPDCYLCVQVCHVTEKFTVDIFCVKGEYGESGPQGFLHWVSSPGRALSPDVGTWPEGQLLSSHAWLLPLYVGCRVPIFPPAAPESCASPHCILATNTVASHLPNLLASRALEAPQSSCEKRNHQGGNKGRSPS